MAFIFTPERDPRRENMSEFKLGTKVNYRGMSMPAEILSGPHRSPGTARYLILKADGNVSLVPERDLTRIVTRLDKTAGTLAMNLYGRSYASLDFQTQVKLARAAQQILKVADTTRGEA